MTNPFDPDDPLGPPFGRPGAFYIPQGPSHAFPHVIILGKKKLPPFSDLSDSKEVVFSEHTQFEFRACELAISTSPKARFSVRLFIGPDTYALGSCDLWPRSPQQIATSFIFRLDALPSLNVAASIYVKILNLRKIATEVFCQINGNGFGYGSRNR